MNSLTAAIGKLVEGKDLTETEAGSAMKCIMSGEATHSQISAFLTSLRIKGETIDEVTALAKVMQEFSARIKPKVDGVLVDTCGTGGDTVKTFNVSTAAMFVAAGAGVKIAKHGNRSVTSKVGSADVVEALGVRIDLPPEEVQRCIEKVGIGFMFAPVFHDAMKHAAPVRRELGVRTVFNILGPLTNPAGAEAQVVGVYDGALTEKVASVLGRLGCKRAMVVHGVDGLDEISTVGATKISELEDGVVNTYFVEPQDFGIAPADPKEIAGDGLNSNSKMLVRAVRGEISPLRDILLLNSAAAVVVGGVAKDIHEGLLIAADAIDSGRAYEKIVQLVNATGGDIAKLRSLEASL